MNNQKVVNGESLNPDPAGARESVIYVQNVATLGDVIRGIHVWAAYLVVTTAVLHLVRIVVTAAYKVPRERVSTAFTSQSSRSSFWGCWSCTFDMSLWWWAFRLVVVYGLIWSLSPEAYTQDVATIHSKPS